MRSPYAGSPDRIARRDRPDVLRWPTARCCTRRAAWVNTCGLVCRLGNGRGDPTPPQVNADRPAGVRLVAQHLTGPGPGSAGATTEDPDPGHHRGEGQRIVP